MSFAWFVLLMAAVLWPSRFLGPLDGAPLDRPLEAIALGLALPWLFWVGREAVASRSFRMVVIALLAWKASTAVIATQQGLCATFRAPEPLVGVAHAISIEEPRGFLRSWDVRADLWDDEPACTAILSRPMRAVEEFPAWFVNITDQMMRRRDFTMTARGVVVGGDGAAKPVSYSLPLGSGAWTFDPTVDGASIWRAPLVSVTTPSSIDRLLAPWAWIVAPLLCALVLLLLLRSAVAALVDDRMALVWVPIGILAGVALAVAPIAALQRGAGLLALGAVAARYHEGSKQMRVAVWTIGAPWLAFFAAMSLGIVGKFSPYSVDDWLTYQLAGYRIYMNGAWIEGGTLTFDYQMLYRWVTGALHLIFGDSSVGELYWDASCLLLGALVSFVVVQRVAKPVWAAAAAAATLMTLTLATPWYVIGRGLSEITAAGLGFAAVACLLRANGSRTNWVALAALFATLMFFARQNQLLWAPCLVAMLIPLSVGSDFPSLRTAWRQMRWNAAAQYLGLFAVGVLLFMARTWYFTGHFSLFYGTSLRHNDTGLRPWSLFDGEVWARVAHSLMGLVFMNEPPRVDPRAAILVSGALVAIAALVQTRLARHIPAALLLVTIGGVAGAFLAHSHGYPGRFTVHLVPFAAALTAIAASAMTNGLTGSDWRVSQSSGT